MPRSTARRQDRPDRFDAGGVTLGLGQAALPSPAPVAVHDDGNVPRQGAQLAGRGVVDRGGGRAVGGTAGGDRRSGCLRPFDRRH